MKSKNKKRILALVLSMVLMLSTGISAMAEGEAGKGTTNGTALENQEPAVENQEENSESADTEGDKTEEIQKTAESEGQSETTEEKVEEETVSEAADLYQDFKDEDGNVITTIHAYVPEGAFQAKADQISMEAKLLDSDSENYIKRMMEEKLPENSYLGGYVLYEVNFMVDGVITEPAKAITLTIEGSGLSVTDLSKTKAFYYDPADPETEGDEDQLIDMGQKADVLNYLVENGVAEDQINTYEYSELDVQNEVAHQIGFNTWKSTIYGCYTEAYSAETAFTQEVDGVTVNVTAPEGAFPTAAENVSFTAAAVTEEQDTVISSQLDAKAEELGQEVKGYETFALSFTVNGEEIQPQIPVSVSFENTGLPAEDVNGAQSFQLDEENRAVNELEGTVENGTASMTLSQMGTVGYWAYGDAVIEEEDSTSAEDENTPDGTEEKQPEDSVEEDSEAVTDDSQGGTDQKEDGQGSAAEDKEEESTEDGKEDTGNPDQEEDSTDGTQDAEDTEGDAVENGSQDDGKSETDTSKEEEGTDTTKEDTEKEDSENKEEVKEEEKEETTEVADEAKEEDADTEKEEETSKEDSKEEAVKEMTYEDDSVTVTVSAEKEGIIPGGATLQVVPLLADDKATKDQYKEVEEKLQEKAENEEYEIAGFLAYDIFFIDKDGNEVEPEGEVKVSMDYKKAALPEGMTEEEAKEADVTMLHLEEDSKGEVKEVVDMAEKDQVETVETTESQMVKKVEVKTESFSSFAITWSYDVSALQNSYEIAIVDSIAEKGQLETQVSETITALENAGAEMSYIWLKKETGTDFGEVDLIKSGTDYNIINDGKALDIIIDGADKEKGTVYKVAVYQGSGENKKLLAESAAFEIPYYRELMNGGFETPISHGQKNYQDRGPSQANAAQWSNENYKYQRGVWQTTGTATIDYQERDIEVLNDKNGEVKTGFMSQGPQKDAEDPGQGQKDSCHQFAEINCEASGALYQDVLTSQKTQLNYWLSHCARSRNTDDSDYRDWNNRDGWKYKDRFDTMYLVIMPTKTAESYKTHRELVKYLNKELADKETIPVSAEKNRAVKEEAKIIYNQGGLLIAKITSNEKDWHYVSTDNITCDSGVSPTYIPTSSLTRFFFISGATAAGDVSENGERIGDTIGNLVDDIHFTQDLPPAEAGSVSIQIRKEITGLTKDQVEALQGQLSFKIVAKDKTNGNVVDNAPLNGTEIKASAMNLNIEEIGDGIVTATITSDVLRGENMQFGNQYLYEVEEIGAEVTGMTVATSTNVNATNGEVQDNGAILGEQGSAVFNITNTYTPIDIDTAMDYNKTVHVANWDERTYNITINASSKLTSTTTTEKDAVADVMMVLDTSGSMLYGSDNNDDDGLNYSSRVGQFSAIKSKLDTTKVYYYSKNTTQVEYKEDGYTWKYTNAKSPMIYQNGQWTYYNGKRWMTVDEQSNTYIYKLDSSLTGLKEAAIAFSKDLTANSPESRIGVATFNSVGSKTSPLTGVSDSDNLSKMIASIYASAGTRPHTGLKIAQDELETPRENVPQYVIFFTDGQVDEGGEGNRDNYQTYSYMAKNIATALKNKGVTIYSVGLNLDDTTFVNEIASPGCALTADNTDELKEIFEKIQGSITSNPAISNATIKDVIDPRFIILDDSGTPITENYEGIEKGVKLKNGGTVYYDTSTGYQYIVWNEQTIPNQEKGEVWKETFQVQAKENYIGGNNVTTNISPDSKISTGYGDAVLPQPAVNVKAELEVGNYDVTIFKGDSVPTEEGLDSVVDSLFDVSAILEKYNNSADPLEESDLTLKWYKDSNLSNPVTEADLEDALNSPETDVTYYLKVTYDAGNPSADRTSTDNTDGHIAGYDDGNSDTIVQAKNSDQDTYPGEYYGVYKVNVKSGSIQIKKRLAEMSDKDQSFTFQIKNEDGILTSVSITVPANKTLAEAEKITGLSRGEYTITEEVIDGYSIKGISTEGSNCKVESENNEITFTMGTFLDGDKEKDTIADTEKKYDKGILGNVEFTNEKTIGNWEIVKKSSSDDCLTLGDAQFTLTKKGEDNPSYYGKSVSDEEGKGKVEWYVDNSYTGEPTKITEGTYILKEIKAPLGYQKSNVKWEIEIAQNGGLKQISLDGEIIKGESVEDPETGVVTVQYVYLNDAVYDLPSSGGTGIFLYMIGGTLLLIAGSLMIYINRRKGVLRK